MHLRFDQHLKDMDNEEYQDANVKEYAPEWVRSGLERIQESIPKDVKFYDESGGTRMVRLSDPLDLNVLVMLSRSESSKVSGVVVGCGYKAGHTVGYVSDGAKALVV